jgi:hypothetical protein
MSRRNCSGSLSTLVVVAAALGILAPVQLAVADVITSFSVGLSDQTLIYPSDLPALPDEHTTFLRQPAPLGSAVGSTTYLVFGAATSLPLPAGAIALQTSDLTSFIPAPGYTNPVMVPPNLFMTCNLPPASNTGFDENYAAPGSVLRDPTRPAGHFIMIYEAENHCPGGTWQRPFYASVGFARSADYGKTWPAPGAAGRRPVLQMSTPEPTTNFTTYMGNAIPSAFIEPIVSSSTISKQPHYVYVTYLLAGTADQGNDGYLRVARADLNDDPVTFQKWYVSGGTGSFSQPGLGGLDSGVTKPTGTRGCVGMPQTSGATTGEYQIQGQISYFKAIDQYLLTFVCVQLSNGTPYQAGWYYATASSLELQNWTTPQLITNSLLPVTPACNPSDMSGDSFDGWYPSFMSPSFPTGHLGKTGQVFFLTGCDTGTRSFKSRTFAITTGP